MQLYDPVAARSLFVSTHARVYEKEEEEAAAGKGKTREENKQAGPEETR